MSLIGLGALLNSVEYLLTGAFKTGDQQPAAGAFHQLHHLIIERDTGINPVVDLIILRNEQLAGFL